MPQKNSIKRYYENGFYHIYNRGVEKRNIYVDQDDYLAFLHLLKTSLSEAPKQGGTLTDITEVATRSKRKNFYGKVDLLCYALMPNHFHLLLRQKGKTSMTQLLRSICTSYSMYFNKKYDRVGSLFQGVFKAVDIDDENYFLWVSRYIHRNPENFQTYPYSSYEDYLGKRQTTWLNTKTILDIFGSSDFRKTKNYQNFVEDEAEDPIDLNYLLIENDIDPKPRDRVEP